MPKTNEIRESVNNSNVLSTSSHETANLVYKDAKGELRPMYYLTRDGFTFLAMGFTGKVAAKFKENYINAFNGKRLYTMV